MAIATGQTDFRPLIIIPVYNGREPLCRLLSGYSEPTDVLVVDDGSSDGLRAEDLGSVHFLRHALNQGKGAALVSGFNWARIHGYTHALSLDADGQHPLERVSDFLAAAREFPAAMILARRNWRPDNMPIHRILSNTITSFALSLRMGQRIPDSQVGMRVYPLINPQLWNISSGGFQFESEVLLQANELKIRFVSIPIPVIYAGEVSHMDNVGDTLRFTRMFFRSFLR